MATVVVVVADVPDLLATYLPEGAQFAFADGHPLGPHPWSGRPAWQGHGVLMLQRPGESYAVWHFWDGPQRDFAGWYVNLQEPFRRTTLGFDTQDLELDLWAPAEGGWALKDNDLLDVRVFVDTPDDVRGNTSRGVDAVPLCRLKSGKSLLGHGGQIGQRGNALGHAGRDGAQLAGFDVRHQCGRPRR